MDNLTHTLACAALAKTRLGRVSPFAFPAMLVAGNLADLDGVTAWFGGREAYLLHHRGITHSIVGTIVMAPVFAWLVRKLEQWRRAEDPRLARGLGPLFLSIFVAFASHPLLDLLNTYGVRPWLPFDAARYYSDLVYIVDPWLWLMLGAGVALSGARSRWGSVWLALVAIGVSVLVYTSERTPGFVAWAWPWPVLAIGLARYKGLGRQHPHRALITAALAMIAYLGLLEWSGTRAHEHLRDSLRQEMDTSIEIEQSSRSPWLADPFGWTVSLQTRKSLFKLHARLGDKSARIQVFPRNMEDPRVRRAAEGTTGRVWKWFARYPLAAIEERDGITRVWLMDGRYQPWPGPSWSSLLVEFPSAELRTE